MTIELFEGTPQALKAYLDTLTLATIQVIPTHQKGVYLLIYT